MNAELRAAAVEDVGPIAALLDELGHPLDPARIAMNLGELQAAGLAPLVAVVDGAVVGLCALWITRTLHRPAPLGRISTMVVTERLRGQGIGAALVAEAERLLRDAGCYLIEVTSNLRRDRAHAFYERLGYERSSYRFFKPL